MGGIRTRLFAGIYPSAVGLPRVAGCCCGVADSASTLLSFNEDEGRAYTISIGYALFLKDKALF